MTTDQLHAELLERIEQLEYDVGVQRDIEEVRRLQFAYNYYNSSGLTQQLLDLVSPNAVSIEIGGQGVFHGKEGFRRLFSQYNRGRIEDRTGAFGSVPASYHFTIPIRSPASSRRTPRARLSIGLATGRVSSEKRATRSRRLGRSKSHVPAHTHLSMNDGSGPLLVPTSYEVPSGPNPLFNPLLPESVDNARSGVVSSGYPYAAFAEWSACAQRRWPRAS